MPVKRESVENCTSLDACLEYLLNRSLQQVAQLLCGIVVYIPQVKVEQIFTWLEALLNIILFFSSFVFLTSDFVVRESRDECLRLSKRVRF